LAEDVRIFFAREPAGNGEVFVSTDGDHGRIEIRRCRVSHDVAWLSTNRRFPGEPRFPGLAMIGMVEAEVEREGKTSLSRRYYLSSAPLSAQQFAAAARAHWGVENRLHWVRDVVFHDDLMRLRTENGPANMAVLTHFILNLVKKIPDKASLKTRRKTLGWDDQYLQNAITRTWK
jgi:predicted transposase YbfD/YdcC